MKKILLRTRSSDSSSSGLKKTKKKSKSNSTTTSSSCRAKVFLKQDHQCSESERSDRTVSTAASSSFDSCYNSNSNIVDSRSCQRLSYEPSIAGLTLLEEDEGNDQKKLLVLEDHRRQRRRRRASIQFGEKRADQKKIVQPKFIATCVDNLAFPLSPIPTTSRASSRNIILSPSGDQPSKCRSQQSQPSMPTTVTDTSLMNGTNGGDVRVGRQQQQQQQQAFSNACVAETINIDIYGYSDATLNTHDFYRPSGSSSDQSNSYLATYGYEDALPDSRNQQRSMETNDNQNEYHNEYTHDYYYDHNQAFPSRGETAYGKITITELQQESDFEVPVKPYTSAVENKKNLLKKSIKSQYGYNSEDEGERLRGIYRTSSSSSKSSTTTSSKKDDSVRSNEDGSFRSRTCFDGTRLPRRSSMKNSSSFNANGGSIVKPERRRRGSITFKEDNNEVVEVQPMSELVDDPQSLHYHRADYEVFKQKIADQAGVDSSQRKLFKHARTKIMKQKHCTRGLEKYLSQKQRNTFKERKDHGRKIVLGVQNLYDGDVDAENLALAYSSVITDDPQKEAAKRAQKDAKEAARYLKSTRKKCRRMSI